MIGAYFQWHLGYNVRSWQRICPWHDLVQIESYLQYFIPLNNLSFYVSWLHSFHKPLSWISQQQDPGNRKSIMSQITIWMIAYMKAKRTDIATQYISFVLDYNINSFLYKEKYLLLVIASKLSLPFFTAYKYTALNNQCIKISRNIEFTMLNPIT